MNRALSTIIALVAFAFLLSSCATVERTDSDDPFSNQLDTLYAKRVNSGDWTLAFAVILASGVIAGTVGTTLYNTNNLGAGVAIPLIASSYVVSILSAGCGTYTFFNYKKYFNEYLETLRLQTQYYNSVYYSGNHQ
jgi:hypothetical protein